MKHALILAIAIGLVDLNSAVADDPAAEPRFANIRPTQRAVAAGLKWLAAHQNDDGSWHFDYSGKCKDPSCRHAGTMKDDTSATALALLTYLGAGLIPAPNHTYGTVLKPGLVWLVNDMREASKPDAAKTRSMSTHALAAICFCEAYAQKEEKELGTAVKAEIRAIEDHQNPDGGWADKPGDPSNLVVFGWQIMALKSAALAKISVDPDVLRRAQKYIQTLSKGAHGGLFASAPDKEVSPTATAVGMLGMRILVGAKADDPAIVEGKAYLIENLASADKPDPVYWFFGAQAMHCYPGPQWDTWNRQTRKVLVKAQSRENENCAAGSWFFEMPRETSLEAEGGRLATTALSILSIEVYYRYLRIFRPDWHAWQVPVSVEEK